MIQNLYIYIPAYGIEYMYIYIPAYDTEYMYIYIPVYGIDYQACFQSLIFFIKKCHKSACYEIFSKVNVEKAGQTLLQAYQWRLI